MSTARALSEHVISFVSVEEYLRNSYAPDMDFVDGRLEERNLGEWDHARLQAALTSIFFQHEEAWSIQVAPEARLQISASRYRVPDVMIVEAGQQIDRVVHSAPLLCIEVLSPGDTWRRMEEKLDDYIAMGVANIWVFDPTSREIFVCTGGARRWLTGPELTIENTAISISVSSIFRVLPAR